MIRRFLIPLILIPICIQNPAKAFWWNTNSSRKCTNKNYSIAEVSKQSKPGVVQIKTNNSSGSGFVVRHIKNQTLILTNSHVVTGFAQAFVLWPDGEEDIADVVLNAGGLTNKTDLALLKVQGKEGKVLPFKTKQAIVGEDVIAIGAPMGFDFTFTRGIISSLRNQGTIIQTDAAINPGNSGGPLLNRSGCVVGVNTFIRKDAEGINFAISSKLANRFVNKYSLNSPKEKKIVVNKISTPNIKPDPQIKKKDAPDEKKNPSFIEDQKPPVEKDKKEKTIQYDQAAKDYINRIKKIYDIKGKEKETIKLANISLSLADNARAYWYRAFAKDGLGDYQGAIEDYTKAYEIDKTIKWTLVNRGISKVSIKNYEGAVDDYTKVIKSNFSKDQKAIAYKDRGYVKYMFLDDPVGGLGDLNTSIMINQDDEEAYFFRGRAKLALADYEGAINDFNIAKDLDSTINSTHIYLGKAKLFKKDYEGALEHLNIAIELEPNDSLTLKTIGDVKGWTKDHEAAIKAYSQAIKINNFSEYELAQTFNDRGNRTSDLGNYKKAIEDYDKSIQIAISINNKGIHSIGLANRAIAKVNLILRNDQNINQKKKGYQKALKDLNKANELQALNEFHTKQKQLVIELINKK
tara:strand:- start:194 stop:2092 length:1899 start_codon:yes stop_codon:yes gene_type:complete